MLKKTSNLIENDLSQLPENVSKIIEKAKKTNQLNLYSDTSKMLMEYDLNLEFIERIDVIDNAITAKNLDKILKNAKNLKVLSFFHCRFINDEILNDLNLELLEVVSLSSSNINSQNLSKILKNAKNLKMLAIESCRNINGEILNDLNLESLEEIYLSRNNMTVKDLSEILKNAKNLKTLDLSSFEKITDEILDDINLESLENVNLSYSQITAQNFSKILKNTKNLKKLDLCGCKNITDEILDDINLESLKNINLLHSNITALNLSKILNKAKNLQIINCHDMTKISVRELIEVIKNTNVTKVYSRFDNEALEEVLEKNKQLRVDRLKALGGILSKKSGQSINYPTVQKICGFIYGKTKDSGFYTGEDGNTYDRVADVAYSQMEYEKKEKQSI